MFADHESQGKHSRDREFHADHFFKAFFPEREKKIGELLYRRVDPSYERGLVEQGVEDDEEISAYELCRDESDEDQQDEKGHQVQPWDRPAQDVDEKRLQERGGDLVHELEYQKKDINSYEKRENKAKAP